jgi:hypothetical protein
MEAQPGSAVGSRRRREAECDDGAEGELISASCGAVLDDPLHDLSNNHPKQDRDCEEQPFRLHVPRVWFSRLARVRLGFVLLVRHAASYTKPPAQAPRRSRGSPTLVGTLTGDAHW